VRVTGAPSDDELLDALGGRLDGRPIVALRRAPYAYATSAPLEEVQVVTEGGESTLILKDLARERLIGDARTSKPLFLHDPRRELETYRRILAPAGIGPRCAAAFRDDAAGRFWLLIDKVPGVELWQIGELEVWEAVAAWLARMHLRFAAAPDRLAEANGHLLDHTAAWFARWADRAKDALGRSEDPRAPALRDALAGYDDVAGALAAAPRTLVHGELYPSNVLVVVDGTDVSVFPVDWEMAAIGPGAIDLAALVGGWAPAERERLEDAYRAEIAAASHPLLDAGDLADQVRRSRLHLALQWIGWAEGWQPPSEHAHDWLGTALTLSEELGLR
jgi:aminoglycoside phosphotransferase (APT) family kinase protein